MNQTIYILHKKSQKLVWQCVCVCVYIYPEEEHDMVKVFDRKFVA